MLFPIKIPQGADALLAQAEAAQQESPVVEAFAQLAGTSTEHIISISLGALFVGVILSVWLCGFSVVQTYFYFSFSSVNDKKSLKLFVLFVFLVDLSDSILSVSWLWSYLIANYGNIGYALTASGPFSATPALEGVIFVCCTGFFLRRIWWVLYQTSDLSLVKFSSSLNATFRLPSHTQGSHGKSTPYFIHRPSCDSLFWSQSGNVRLHRSS